jgi:hypothetical protein
MVLTPENAAAWMQERGRLWPTVFAAVPLESLTVNDCGGLVSVQKRLWDERLASNWLSTSMEENAEFADWRSRWETIGSPGDG